MIIGHYTRIGPDTAHLTFDHVSYRQHPSRSWSLLDIVVTAPAAGTARAALADALRAALAALDSGQPLGDSVDVAG